MRARRAGWARIGGGLVLAAALGLPAKGDTPEEIFNQGNTAYEKGRFEEAVEAYRRVIQYGAVDARVEYNLGNAYYRLGRLGEAILHYERARRLDPTDPDTVANLELARSRCVDKVEVPETAAAVRWMRSAQNRLGTDGQAAAMLGLVWLIFGLVTWRSMRPGGWNPLAGWALAGLLLATLVVGLSWSATERRLEGTRIAVVLEPSVQVLAGPGENNASLFTVHEGLTVEIRAERQEWIQVSLPNGLHGWLPKDAVGRV